MGVYHGTHLNQLRGIKQFSTALVESAENDAAEPVLRLIRCIAEGLVRSHSRTTGSIVCGSCDTYKTSRHVNLHPEYNSSASNAYTLM